jgi:FtsZ-interacting cell division protein ZipA
MGDIAFKGLIVVTYVIIAAWLFYKSWRGRKDGKETRSRNTTKRTKDMGG